MDRGFPPEKVHVLRLGVDTSLFSPAKDYEFKRPLKIVYFGYLSIRKGVHYLLEATKKFSPQELELHLIGSVEREFKPILEKSEKG